MPIIIDANRAGDFSNPCHGQAEMIIKGISKRKVRVSLGGHLLRELVKTRLRDLIAEWNRIGIIHRIDDKDVDAEEKKFKARGIKSDDPHILALASLASCRLLYTDDLNLISDFKDVAFIKPKGKVMRPSTTTALAEALLRKFGG